MENETPAFIVKINPSIDLNLLKCSDEEFARLSVNDEKLSNQVDFVNEQRSNRNLSSFANIDDDVWKSFSINDLIVECGRFNIPVPRRGGMSASLYKRVLIRSVSRAHHLTQCIGSKLVLTSKDCKLKF
jgi:hypothetical protein